MHAKLVLCEKKGRDGRKIKVVGFYPQAYGVMVFSFREWDTFVRLCLQFRCGIVRVTTNDVNSHPNTHIKY